MEVQLLPTIEVRVSSGTSYGARLLHWVETVDAGAKIGLITGGKQGSAVRLRRTSMRCMHRPPRPG